MFINLFFEVTPIKFPFGFHKTIVGSLLIFNSVIFFFLFISHICNSPFKSQEHIKFDDTLSKLTNLTSALCSLYISGVLFLL